MTARAGSRRRVGEFGSFLTKLLFRFVSKIFREKPKNVTPGKLASVQFFLGKNSGKKKHLGTRVVVILTLTRMVKSVVTGQAPVTLE